MFGWRERAKSGGGVGLEMAGEPGVDLAWVGLAWAL